MFILLRIFLCITEKESIQHFQVNGIFTLNDRVLTISVCQWCKILCSLYLQLVLIYVKKLNYHISHENGTKALIEHEIFSVFEHLCKSIDLFEINLMTCF